MGKEFEGVDEVEVTATPEQVWQAIATGPGIDSWFMGRNEVTPGSEGHWRLSFGDYRPTLDVAAWEDRKHLTYRTDAAPDGRFVAYEFLIEGRGSGSTVLRMATSGFLPGDDWEDEFEAMTAGGELFFQTLVCYLQHFAGRAASPVTVFGPLVSDWPRTWTKLFAALGLSDPRPGDPVDVTLHGLPRMAGVVYHRNEQTLGLRTPDAMYRFIRGFNPGNDGPLIASHHVFTEIDPNPAERAWQSWLDTFQEGTQS